MRELMETIFGTYTPNTVMSIGDDGNVVVETLSGMAGVDWVYVGEVFLFGIALLSIFKLIGVLLKC